MRKRLQNLVLTIAALCLMICFQQPTAVNGREYSVPRVAKGKPIRTEPWQPKLPVRIFRGSVGQSHIEMRLRFARDSVSGTYSYDRVKKDLSLTGRFQGPDQLVLTEFDADAKPTGRFVCKPNLEDAFGIECNWSKPDGTGEKYAFLNEQHDAFTNGLRVVPKLITTRKAGIDVSYPQLTGGDGALAAAVENFNRRMSYLVNKAIKDFTSGESPEGNSFDTNYSVLLGTNELVSIEMAEDSYSAGAAHPNSHFWTVNYDLAANRELKLTDLFQPKTAYKSAIMKQAAIFINKHAEEVEREEALLEKRKIEPRNEPLVPINQLPEIDAWAITPKGLNIYFDFPHVMAVFDKAFVPYSVVKRFLKSTGPATRVAQMSDKL